MKTYKAFSEAETKDIAKKISAELNGGTVLCLYGDLGAGKTTFVKGIAEGLMIKEDITSPTFTLMNIYKTNSSEIKTLVHIDTYRLKNAEELIQIGAEDYLGRKDVLFIVEWPEKIESLLQDKKIIKIKLNHLSDNQREIFFTED